jgi:HK97 family phage prohead protease
MPFSGYENFAACVADQKSKGKSDESAKKICGALQAKTESMENVKLKWTEKFNVQEQGEETLTESQGKNKWIKIGGTAVEAVTSKNNRKYLAEELAKQDIKGIKIFLNHHSEDAMNAVGVIESYGFDGTKLKYEGKVRNTSKNQDVVEMVKDGLINNVSIGATGDLKRVVENNQEIYEVRNLKIEELSLVGIGGVPGAGIDFATAVTESLNLENKENVVKEQRKKFLIMRR